MSIRKIDALKRSIVANNLDNPSQLEYLAAVLRRQGANLDDILVVSGSSGHEIKIANHRTLTEDPPGTLIYIDYYNDEWSALGDGYDVAARSPVIYVWADPDLEEATHRIDISKAYENP